MHFILFEKRAEQLDSFSKKDKNNFLQKAKMTPFRLSSPNDKYSNPNVYHFYLSWVCHATFVNISFTATMMTFCITCTLCTLQHSGLTGSDRSCSLSVCILLSWKKRSTSTTLDPGMCSVHFRTLSFLKQKSSYVHVQ